MNHLLGKMSHVKKKKSPVSQYVYFMKVKVFVTQSCPTLWDPIDCSLPGSSVHGILQARILEWVAMPFSRESSLARDWTQVFCTAGRFFTVWATREACELLHELNRIMETYKWKVTASEGAVPPFLKNKETQF